MLILLQLKESVVVVILSCFVLDLSHSEHFSKWVSRTAERRSVFSIGFLLFDFMKWNYLKIFEVGNFLFVI